MEYVIAVDLGGTQLRAALADRQGQLVAQVRVPTRTHEGPAAVIDRIAGCIEQVRAALPAGGELLGIGIGSPGPLDPERGIVLAAPNMPGWIDIPLRAAVSERTGLPTVIGNDANAAALGEWRFGGGGGRRHMVYVTVSTGIGGGVIVDGHLLLGHRGCGGEVGLMLVQGRATWESLASGTALGRAAATAMALNPNTLLHQLATPATVTAAHVSQAAAQNDLLALELMQREGELLGLGFVNVLHLFSPEIILVGGSVVTANPTLLERARQVAHEEVAADVYRSVPIEVASLGEQVGLLGAVALLLYAYEGR